MSLRYEKLVQSMGGKSRRIIYAVILIAFMLLVSSVFTFNRNLGNKLEENAAGRMLDVADSQRALVLAHVTSMERELRTDVANMRNMELDTWDDMFDQLQIVVASSNFQWLCVSQFDGQTTCTGCSEHLPLSSEAINKVMSGEYHVRVLKDMVEIVVPVHDDKGQVICAISGGYPPSKLTEFSRDFVRRYSGNLFIVQQDGTLLASAGDTRRLTGMWGNLSQFFDNVTFENGTADDIYSHMKVSARSSVVVRSGRQRILVTYSPTDIDGWYIFSMIPYNAVESDTVAIRNDAYSISIQLILASTMIVVYLFVTNRRQLEAIHEQQKEMRASATRYRLISARTKDIIVEYDLRKELMLHCENAPMLDAAELRGVNFPQKLISMGIIHPEDAGMFHNNIQAASEGQSDVEMELRIKLSHGDYKWHRLSMACVFDERGAPWRVVARVNNIDQQKIEAQLLEQRAVRDPLTKLYNKGGTRIETEKILAEYPERCHALMIIDIDNFKHFNDNHGHLFGDQVLAATADKMNELFRSNDVLGRVGGDEFLIFCRDIGSASNASRRAQQMVSLLHEVGVSLTPPVSTSCSIGIAMTPMHGVQFEELYERADQALYAVKARGKDGYALFDSDKDVVKASE